MCAYDSFFKTGQERRDCSGGVWSKSPISQKIVPRNRNSKSLEGKQFINVRLWTDIVAATIVWSKLMHLGVFLSFACHFLPIRVHTLKFESDFYSRQGHWTTRRTGAQDGIKPEKKQRWSSFSLLKERSFFVVTLCKKTNFLGIIYTEMKYNKFKEILCPYKISIFKNFKKEEEIWKEEWIVVGRENRQNINI